jgi:hypothetical protein
MFRWNSFNIISLLLFANNGQLKIQNMDIKILGTGCPKCKTLESLIPDVVAKNGIEVSVSKVGLTSSGKLCLIRCTITSLMEAFTKLYFMNLSQQAVLRVNAWKVFWMKSRQNIPKR